MNRKGKKKYTMIVAIGIILVVGMAFFITKSGANNTTQTSTSSTQIVEVKVSTQTIQNTLTSSGQISSSGTEKLSLTSGRYFSTMCVEEDDTVLEGENILKYTNGTYLKAPYDCIITSYMVPETGSVCSSSHVVEVQNLETLQMTLSIDESEINKVQVGQKVDIVLSAFEDKTYEGSITKINAVGNYASSGSTFTATVQFENDGNVKIGMSASCTIILEEAENCIAVPIQAIQTKEDTKYVVVVNQDGTTQDISVETGISNDSYVQILSGLEGNESIQMLQTTSSTGTRKVTSGNGSSTSRESFGGGMQGGSSMGAGQMPQGGRNN